MSMVATNSRAAEVMWKMMMKASSTNMVAEQGRRAATGHDESPRRGCAEEGRGQIQICL